MPVARCSPFILDDADTDDTTIIKRIKEPSFIKSLTSGTSKLPFDTSIAKEAVELMERLMEHDVFERCRRQADAIPTHHTVTYFTAHRLARTDREGTRHVQHRTMHPHRLHSAPPTSRARASSLSISTAYPLRPSTYPHVLSTQRCVRLLYRYDARGVRSCAFFEGLSWEQLLQRRLPPLTTPQASDPFDTGAFDAADMIEDGDTGEELLALEALPYAEPEGTWDEAW